MNCGRSSSVEWKLPKLQRRVRFPSPAPPPPGYAPGGFVMPPRQARLASHALFYLPLAPLTQPCGRAPGTKLPQHAALAGRTGTKLSQLTAQRATPVQNSPRSQPSRVEPVQNSPRTPKMAHFSTYYASRENFVTLSPPTRRAGRKKSRTNTPPHPPTRPSPNFACNSIA